MVDVRLYVIDDKVGEKFQRSTVTKKNEVLANVRAAADAFEKDFLQRARADIANAGNFGKRWTEGLRVTRSEGGGNIRIDVTHDVPYFMVHQRGAVIKGKPLLWIPLSFASDALGVSAKDYPGRLFRVDRKRGGAPLLLAEGGEPKYSGHESVTIPKRFHVVEIARELMNRMRDYYNKVKKS